MKLEQMSEWEQSSRRFWKWAGRIYFALFFLGIGFAIFVEAGRVCVVKQPWSIGNEMLGASGHRCLEYKWRWNIE